MNTFHLSVWQPMRFSRELHYAPVYLETSSDESILGKEEAPNRFPFSRDDLHEQLFVWSPEEDIWGGIADEAVRTSLKNLFTDTFQASLSPETRSISRLAEITQRLQEVIQKEKASQWVLSSQSVEAITNSPSLSVAPALALLHHLVWIYETFRDVPGISIMVR